MSNDVIDVEICSFGFKYEQAPAAGCVFDVRCFPNPYYIEELRELCGLDSAVYDYVFSFEESRAFAEKTAELIEDLIPLFRKRDPDVPLYVAYGCTGGRHRSVSFARRVGEILCEKGYKCRVTHRQLEKENA